MIFRGDEVWFKTGILNSGLIFMGLFFGLRGLFRSEFDGELWFRSWFYGDCGLWTCLKYGLVEGILELVVMKKLGINVGFKVGIGCNFLWIRGILSCF